MQVEPEPGYPYPHMFLVGGIATGATPPVRPVGVLVVRQTFPFGPVTTQEKVLMADVLYPAPATGDLTVQFESELAPSKPSLDVVAVRASSAPGIFGVFRLDRGAGFGSAITLPFGWRDRSTAPRLLEAGNAGAFTPVQVTDPSNPPTLEEKLALPSGFSNAFFNGGHTAGLAHLAEDDVVRFEPASGGALDLTIPAAPDVTLQGVANPPAITMTADTVVYDVAASRLFVTWRSVFPWGSALEAATARLELKEPLP